MSAIMRIHPTSLLVLALLVCTLVAPRPAAAQPFDAVGTRAQGMAGAFVAVADDATATWWNPAGLATGAYLNAIIERGESRSRRIPLRLPARRGGPARQVLPSPIPRSGLSYYRVRVSQVAPRSTVYRGTPARPTRSRSGGDRFAFGGDDHVRHDGRSVGRQPPGPGVHGQAGSSRHGRFDRDCARRGTRPGGRSRRPARYRVRPGSRRHDPVRLVTNRRRGTARLRAGIRRRRRTASCWIGRPVRGLR